MEMALADMATQGAVVIDPVEIPLLDTLSGTSLFCNRFRYDLEAYLASRDGAPVTTLTEIVAAGLFDPTAEERVRRALAIAETPEAQDPPCVDVREIPGGQL